MPTNFPAPKPTAGVALIVRIVRETVGAFILTVAIVLLWLGLVHVALAVARAGMQRGETGFPIGPSRWMRPAFRPGFAGRRGILGRTAVIFIQDLAPSRWPDLI